MRGVCRAAAAVIAALALAVPAGAEWTDWGADPGGTRYAPLQTITPSNADQLIEAWRFSTGDLASKPERAMRRSKFETTPIRVADSLVFCSPFNEVIALDPG